MFHSCKWTKFNLQRFFRMLKNKQTFLFTFIIYLEDCKIKLALENSFLPSKNPYFVLKLTLYFCDAVMELDREHDTMNYKLKLYNYKE